MVSELLTFVEKARESNSKRNESLMLSEASCGAAGAAGRGAAAARAQRVPCVGAASHRVVRAVGDSRLVRADDFVSVVLCDSLR